MAVVRARSAPPYGLFAAVVFAVLATGAAVVFYMMWTKAAEDHDTLASHLKDATANVEQLRTANGDLQTNLKKANDKADLAARGLESSRTEVAGLRQQIQSDQAALAKASNDARDASAAKTAALQAALNYIKGQPNDQDIKDESDKALVSNIQATLENYKKTLAEENAAKTKELSEALDKANDEADKARRPLVLENQQLKGQLAKAEADLRDANQRIQNMRGKTDLAVGEPDGKVMFVDNANGQVYINLGKQDRVTAGMPFTCYDARTGVRFGTDEAALGNGSIEVTQVQDKMAICRVTRTSPNRAIQAGDVISNIVYNNDKTRKFRFTVYGDFDLDGDGVATAAERERLIILIKAWGGEVDDEVTSQTDFLVLGQPPKSPTTDTPASSTPADAAAATAPSAGTVGSVAAERVKDQNRYEELDITARRLAIPVLNQNRFLAMVGYYNTTVVRY